MGSFPPEVHVDHSSGLSQSVFSRIGPSCPLSSPSHQGFVLLALSHFCNSLNVLLPSPPQLVTYTQILVSGSAFRRTKTKYVHVKSESNWFYLKILNLQVIQVC